MKITKVKTCDLFRDIMLKREDILDNISFISFSMSTTNCTSPDHVLLYGSALLLLIYDVAKQRVVQLFDHDRDFSSTDEEKATRRNDGSLFDTVTAAALSPVFLRPSVSFDTKSEQQQQQKQQYLVSATRTSPKFLIWSVEAGNVINFVDFLQSGLLFTTDFSFSPCGDLLAVGLNYASGLALVSTEHFGDPAKRPEILGRNSSVTQCGIHACRFSTGAAASHELIIAGGSGCSLIVLDASVQDMPEKEKLTIAEAASSRTKVNVARFAESADGRLVAGVAEVSSSILSRDPQHYSHVRIFARDRGVPTGSFNSLAAEETNTSSSSSFQLDVSCMQRAAAGKSAAHNNINRMNQYPTRVLVRSVAFLNSHLLAVVGDDFVLRVFDIYLNQQMTTVRLRGANITVSPDRRTIYSLCERELDVYRVEY